MAAKKAAKSISLDNAVGGAALKKLAAKKPEQLLAEFKEQGITSLEDLAKDIVASAKSASRAGGVAFDDEIFGVCYKFTSYRPVFDQAKFKEIVIQIDKQLLR
jgi:hypothetical protein